MTAGYSGTPLVKKLGLKPGARALFVGAPTNYPELLNDIPATVNVLRRAGKNMDFIHLFVSSRARLHERLPALKRALAPTGMLWISWPKKSSQMTKDLSESDVRNAGLAAGLVDVKICAVDEDWSGLKFVYRVEDRW